MLLAGDARRRIVRTLNAAYADGLLSEETFARRLDESLANRLIDSRRLIGDLNLRKPHGRLRARFSAKMSTVIGRLEHVFGELDDAPETLLALDWPGGQQELLVGRHDGCHVHLADLTVSRRHARLIYRDGHWVLQDLTSTNGTFVNGVRVGRSALRPEMHEGRPAGAITPLIGAAAVTGWGRCRVLRLRRTGWTSWAGCSSTGYARCCWRRKLD